ncbi:hypothetical protein [Desulfonema magnum]|uniref:Uncharacterized protein n=1 Tax=Desulfonema magnum TaxID=45655 RepID=A0A975BLU2_9BACT|nr:hypothetical protein [Desulfonema magnum]QTA87856.1 Uncharacterized protein dnm_038940 [Desulfonema magnum]
MKSESKPQKTRWHRLLGRLFRELLVPTGILVYTDVPVMGEPPEADILLLRKKRSRWTEEQRSRLPDGVRDTRATHILIEFKYTESVNRKVLAQTLCYDYLYKGGQKLGDHDVRTFLASSKTPRASTLEKFGWYQTDRPGVYKSHNPLAESVTLILLNELADTPHNAWIKCFASRRREKKSAFETLMDKRFSSLSSQLQWFLEGLLHYWFTMGGEHMDIEITPDDVMKIGKKWQQAVLSGISPKDRLAGLAPKDRLAGLAPKDRLAGLELKDILAEFTQEEIEAYLKKLKKKQRK